MNNKIETDTAGYVTAISQSQMFALLTSPQSWSESSGKFERFAGTVGRPLATFHSRSFSREQTRLQIVYIWRHRLVATRSTSCCPSTLTKVWHTF